MPRIKKTPNKLLKKLFSLKPAKVKLTQTRVEFSLDGKKIAYRIVASGARGHVGDWHRGKPVVFVDSHLKGLDWQAVALHEAVEKFVAEKYSLDVDSEAHSVAEKIEEKWLKARKGNWRSHQLKVFHDWKKHGKK